MNSKLTTKEIKICVAQMDVSPAKPKENVQKMLSIIEKAKLDNADLVVSSELCVPGYLLGDTWERDDFLDECIACEKEIVAASEDITIAFGNVGVDRKRKNEDGRVRKYNQCIIAKDGMVVDRVTKTLQPNYREFDDNRHFYDNRKLIFDLAMEMKDYDLPTYEIASNCYNPSIEIKGYKIGCMLCEDGWNSDYTFSPMTFLAPKCDLIVNISCSPFTLGKNSKRNRVFSKHAKDSGKPIIYVNNVGAQNNGKTIYTFDGGSCIYCGDKSFNFYAPFEEGASVFTIADGKYSDNSSQDHSENYIEMLYKSLVYGIRKFTTQLGINKVVIGASGGIDSAVVASLFSKVLNPKDIHLVNMPSRYNSNTTKDLAGELSRRLNCNYYIMPIDESVALTKKQFNNLGMELSDFTMENVQARDRSARILAALSSHIGAVFTCNANKSEATVGYTTLYGDLSGFMAPLADVWKTDVYALARYINNISDVELIPQGIMDVVPSAELSNEQNVDEGKGDPIIYKYHDKLFHSWVERWDRATPTIILEWLLNDNLSKELGVDYDIIKTYFNGSKEEFIKDLERWWNLYNGFAYAKRVQAPPVLAVSRRSYGFDLRETQNGKAYYSDKYLELKKKILGS